MTKNQAKLELFDNIEIWYNRKRRHSALGDLSPKLFEKLLLNYNKLLNFFVLFIIASPPGLAGNGKKG